MEVWTAVYNDAGPSFELTEICLFKAYREILEDFSLMPLEGFSDKNPI